MFHTAIDVIISGPELCLSSPSPRTVRRQNVSILTASVTSKPSSTWSSIWRWTDAVLWRFSSSSPLPSRRTVSQLSWWPATSFLKSVDGRVQGRGREGRSSHLWTRWTMYPASKRLHFITSGTKSKDSNLRPGSFTPRKSCQPRSSSSSSRHHYRRSQLKFILDLLHISPVLDPWVAAVEPELTLPDAGREFPSHAWFLLPIITQIPPPSHRSYHRSCLDNSPVHRWTRGVFNQNSVSRTQSCLTKAYLRKTY